LWKRKKEGIKVEEIKTEVEEFRFTEELIDLLDWERIWQEVYDFKKGSERLFSNLITFTDQQF